MAKLIYRVVSACGALGYGFPRESLDEAVKGGVDAIISDAGSMDAGPHYLGTGTEYFEREAVKNDFRHIVRAAQRARVPVILGSCGMAGGDRNLAWMVDVAKEVFAELDVQDAKVATISAELDPEVVISEFRKGALLPTGRGPELNEATLRESTIVGQMGIHPLITALRSRRTIYPCRPILRRRAVRVRHDPPRHRRGHCLSCRPCTRVWCAGLRSRFAVGLPGGGDL